MIVFPLARKNIMKVILEQSSGMLPQKEAHEWYPVIYSILDRTH